MYGQASAYERGLLDTAEWASQYPAHAIDLTRPALRRAWLLAAERRAKWSDVETVSDYDVSCCVQFGFRAFLRGNPWIKSVTRQATICEAAEAISTLHSRIDLARRSLAAHMSEPISLGLPQFRPPGPRWWEANEGTIARLTADLRTAVEVFHAWYGVSWMGACCP